MMELSEIPEEKQQSFITESASTPVLVNRHSDTPSDKVHVRIVPSIDNPNRCLIFDIVDRELEVGSIIRIGRYSEKHPNTNCMSFKSKVVSRCHSEVWSESDGKLYIRDTKSSSGTFLNHVRLSPAGQESKPVELHDGDIVQLGVDFQGGKEEMYRSVKMKFEINRSKQSRPLSFSLNAFQNIKTLTQPVEVEPRVEEPVEECCICLYALAPFQALFVSPCSHTYHFKCIRPLLVSYPGFQCPICRTYSDLEANVAIDEVEHPCVTSVHTNESSTDLLDQPPLHTIKTTCAPSDIQDTPPPALPSHLPHLPSHPIDTNSSIIHSSSHSNPTEHINEQASTSTNRSSIDQAESEDEFEDDDPISTIPKRQERRSSVFMEKIKMVFFEKRKSINPTQTPAPPQPKQRKPNKPRPLSYPNILSHPMDEAPPLPNRSNLPLPNHVSSSQETQDVFIEN